MDRDITNEAAQGIASGKGKGKEKETMPSVQPRPNNDSNSQGLSSEHNSIISCLTSSTTRLAKDLIATHATAVDLAEVQPYSKAGPSVAAPSIDYTAAANASIRPLSTGSADPGVSFKSSQGLERAISNQPGFSGFLDETSRLEPTEGNRLAISQRLDIAGTRLQPHGRTNGQPTEPTEDGLEVAEFLDSGYDEVVTGDPEVPLPSGEQTALRRALFQDGGQWKRKPMGDYHEDILNFFPDFLISGSGKSADIYNHLGVTDPEDARIIWASHWQDVLANYNDEVWGDLSHLVEEAREELQMLSNSPEQAPPSDSGALRRLQQILAHVRGF